jgi:hypothetical protein
MQRAIVAPDGAPSDNRSVIFGTAKTPLVMRQINALFANSIHNFLIE